MDTKTESALRESIGHWERLANGTAPETESIHSKDCALCSVFLQHGKRQSDCVGCPIYAKTGRKYCSGTPWVNVYNRQHTGRKHPDFLISAGRMLDFLKSLLPENQPTEGPTK